MSTLKLTAFTTRRCWIFHRWSVVWREGYVTHKVCWRCGSRRIEQTHGPQQPVDVDWLLGCGKAPRQEGAK